MATVTGSSGVVKVATSDGSEAVVGEVRSYTIDTTADTIECSSMGDTDREYKAGLASSTVSIECYWDEADAQQIALDPRATIFWEVHPTGTATGEEYYSGSGVVTSKSITASFDGMVEASFGLQVNGAVTVANN